MSARPTSVRFPTLAMALACLAWSEGEQAAPEGRPAIRLSDQLERARIASPLLELAPARDVDELADPAVDIMVEEGFEDFDWESEGWPDVPWAGIAAEGDNHTLRLEELADGPSLGWALPVRPDAFYTFERSVRVQGRPFCDLYVVESRVEVEGRFNADSYFLAGRGAALKVHGLALRAGEDDLGDTWQRGSTSFYPTPRTRSLVIMIRPRVGARGGAAGQATSFDDVRLEEVVPSRTERMQLLKGAHAAPGADPASGLQKAGWLLPLPSPEGVQEGEPAESNYNWRRALYAPPTTELTFDVVFPENARLRAATGLARETPPNAAARFQIELSQPGVSEPEIVFDQVRVARMEEWHWEEVDLDLAAWAGRAGTLTLRTLAEKGDPHPLWADPRIEAVGGADDPLVILIAVDTLRADRLSSYGYELPTTPALDRLASEGVRFDQARSNCNWTCPSFASIFTGLVPARHGVYSYGPATPLPDELVTLAEHFQARGWATRSIAYKVPLFDGNYEQGFDQAFNVPRDVIRGEENLARALEWLEAHRGGPTFLFLHFNDPHQPFVQPAPFDGSAADWSEARGIRAASTAADVRGPDVPIGTSEETRTAFEDLYDGAVAYVDTCIGSFLDALRARGLYEHATIAFVADHGEQLWEHGRFGHGGDALYDEIVRVPLIVKPPAETFEPGRVLAAEVSAFDVMPTLLELAGIAPEDELDARSLVPLIRGEQAELDRVVVTETSQRGLALVDGGYKYVLEPGGQVEALFHLVSDPAELRDLAVDEPDVLACLRRLAIAYVLEHRPGNYLLVYPGDEPARLRIATHAVRKWIGPALGVDRTPEPPESGLDLAASTWVLLELEGPDAEEVAVHGLPSHGLPKHGAVPGFGRWETGRALPSSGAGVWRFQGPEAGARVRAIPPAGAASEAAETIDAEMLEALQRLGYVE